MTDIDYEKTFGFNPESIGHRYRAHHVIDKPDYDDEMAGAKEGYLCVRARDGASNPVDPDACKLPNFVGTVEDGFDCTYRYYYYRPLTDADGVDSAALIASQAARIEELKEGLEPFDEAFGFMLEGTDDYQSEEPVTLTCGRNTTHFLVLGHFRRARSLLSRKGGE